MSDSGAAGEGASVLVLRAYVEEADPDDIRVRAVYPDGRRVTAATSEAAIEIVRQWLAEISASSRSTPEEPTAQEPN